MYAEKDESDKLQAMKPLSVNMKGLLSETG